ncbi:MAG TPA: zinc ABC transporter substrate-binding protein [Chloroflexota bacterium]|nr:zinc ABC transporter substrate-binding protein [Chloroflexota bacterium]
MRYRLRSLAGSPSSWCVLALATLLAIPRLGMAAYGAPAHARSSAPIVVVAAENQYGSLVQAIGGNRVVVTSLLNNPNTDPHEFEASPATARTLSTARFVIKNGIGYDSWIDKLLAASPRSGRVVLSVGEYLGHRTGDNPHVWYAPSGWPREASAIAADLGKLDPAHKAFFRQRASAWLRSMQPVYRAITATRKLTRGRTVIATEPVYGYMIAALGATSLDSAFQKAVMDGTDPSPQSVAQFETALSRHTARMLFYNSQVVDPTTGRMRSLAGQDHVPVVGVTETQPSKLSFAQWQLSQLQSIRQRWKG